MKIIRIQGSIQKIGEISTSKFAPEPKVCDLGNVEVQTPQGVAHYARITLPGGLPVPQENTEVQWAAIDAEGRLIVFASRAAAGWQDHGAQVKAVLADLRLFNMFFACVCGFVASMFMIGTLNPLIQSVSLVFIAMMLTALPGIFGLPGKKRIARLVAALQTEDAAVGASAAGS